MPRKKLSSEVPEFFKKHGARGGKLGGSKGEKTAAANMTAEERRARAKRAVAARVAKLAAGKTKARA